MPQTDHERHAAPCPSDETLAAWLDDRLTPDESKRIEAHVADCDDCAELVAAIVPVLDDIALASEGVLVDMAADAPKPITAFTAPGPRATRVDPAPVHVRWRVRRTLQALAAAVTLAIGGAMFWQRGTDVPPAEDLRALAAVQGDVRQTHGRLVGFPWAEAPRTYRSAAAAGAPRADLLSTAEGIKQQYLHPETPSARHALGVALLLAGDVDSAVESLELAVNARPTDPRFANDAAVAHLQRAWASGDEQDLRRARQLAESIVAQHPNSAEGWFNLMMAGRRAGDQALEARAARRLAELEPAASGWRTELARP